MGTCKALQRWCRLCVSGVCDQVLELSTAQFHTFCKNPPQEAKNTGYARGMHTYTSCAEQSAYIKKIIKNATVHLCNILHSNGLGMFGAHLIFLFGTSSHKCLLIQKNSSKILKFYDPCAPHAGCGSYKCSYKCCTIIFYIHQSPHLQKDIKKNPYKLIQWFHWFLP